MYSERLGIAKRRCQHNRTIDQGCMFCPTTSFFLLREGEKLETLKPEPQPTPPKGAWFVYGWDTAAYPEALFDTEIEALRYAVGLGYFEVKFWEFGKSWDEIKNPRGKPIGKIQDIQQTEDGIVVSGIVNDNAAAFVKKTMTYRGVNNDKPANATVTVEQHMPILSEILSED